MAQFSITVPNEFLPIMDEVVAQTGAGTRDLWLRNAIGNMLIQYQVQKELAHEFERRTLELTNFWR
jgi:metal-responsive CopG/Arc/MetJ family transcriptional regulator